MTFYWDKFFDFHAYFTMQGRKVFGWGILVNCFITVSYNKSGILLVLILAKTEIDISGQVKS